MTNYDRLRIKAEAWADHACAHLPHLMILAGAALLVAAAFGFCAIV